MLIIRRMTLEQFRVRVQRHLSRSGESPTAFGRRVLNDPAWVKRLLSGLEPKEATRAKILQAIKETK